MPGAGQRRLAYSRPFSELALSSWVLVPLAVILGAFVALQAFHLTPRYVKLVFAILFLLATARLPFHLAMALFLVLWPAPTLVFFGDTNTIFIVLMLILWIVRLRLGVLPPRVHTPIDVAILAYLAAHLISFVNISSTFVLWNAARNMVFMVSGILLFVLLVNAMRTEKHVIRGLQALCVTALFVDLTAIFEYYFGIRLVPTWFIFSPALASRFVEGGRASGVFGAHGLLADFSAMSFFIQILLAVRTKRTVAKIYYWGLAALSLLMISNTSNRGGAVIWALGTVYFLWLYRHHIRWFRAWVVVGILVFIVLSMGVMNREFLSRVGLFARLIGTHFEHGIPETRVVVWQRIMEEIPHHLWLGHGPYVELRPWVENRLFWPHNAYLFYLYSTGVVGLATFLWILVTIIRKSFPGRAVDFRRDSWGRATQAIFHIQVVLFAIAQLRGDHQRGNVYIYYMWILFAFALIGLRLAARPRPSLAPQEGVSPASEGPSAHTGF